MIIIGKKTSRIHLSSRCSQPVEQRVYPLQIYECEVANGFFSIGIMDIFRLIAISHQGIFTSISN